MVKGDLDSVVEPVGWRGLYPTVVVASKLIVTPGRLSVSVLEVEVTANPLIRALAFCAYCTGIPVATMPALGLFCGSNTSPDSAASADCTLNPDASPVDLDCNNR